MKLETAMQSMLSSGSVAIITGAASGIGRATAERFGGLGLALGLADLNQERLEATERDLAARGARVLSVVTDVSDIASCRRLVQAVENRFGRIDVLVNSAGVVRPALVEATTDADVELELRVNLFGVINTTRAVLPIMRRQNRGHIVNIASLAAVTPLPGEAVYCASKYGVRGFSLALAVELRHTPLRVSVVHPDSTETPMLAYEATHGGAPLSFSGKILQPDDITDAVVRALQTGKREISVPRSRGWLAMLGELVPPLRDLVVERLERAGARELARRRAGSP
jgi:NAD(P)-dependent dehydrogenase (short-subunit alcohol dehydrogenase family)